MFNSKTKRSLNRTKSLAIKRRLLRCDRLAAYNQLLSEVDSALTEVKEMERQMKAVSEQMLMGVGLKYGVHSLEYEKAGGARKTSRRRKASQSPAPVETTGPAVITAAPASGKVSLGAMN